MRLQERLKRIQEFEDDLNAEEEKSISTRAKQIDNIKRDIHNKLIEKLSDVLFKKKISDVELKLRVQREINNILNDYDIPLTILEKKKITNDLIDDVVIEVEKDEISEMRNVIENTLISAQKIAEEIIKNAKTEANNIKKEAKEKVGDIVLKSQDEIREMLNDIEEVGKIQDNLNQGLNKVYNKLSVVLKIRESEEKESTLKEYLGEEVGEKQVEVKK